MGDFRLNGNKYGGEKPINAEQPTFTEAQTRTNIQSGESVSTLFGKIKKWFSDLKAVAFSGSYTDLQDKPTIPSAQVQSDWTEADNTAVDYIKNKPNLATVATSGSYNDLLNKPTIPSVGGHTIENTSGADLPQEDNLQFVGVYTRDDSVNSRTEVNIVRQMTKAAMQALSSAEKEGFIDTTDEDDDYIPVAAEDVKRGVSDVDADLTALENGKVNRSGDTMTGNLYIQRAGEAAVNVKNTNTGCIAYLDSDVGGNHGIWSNGYWNGSSFVSSGKWLLHRTTDGAVKVNEGLVFAPTTFTNTSFTPTDNTRTTLYTNTSGHTQLVFCSVSAEIRTATGIVYLNKNNDGNNPLANAQLTAVDVTKPQYQHVTLTCFVQLANGDAIKYYPVVAGGTLGNHSVVLAY